MKKFLCFIILGTLLSCQKEAPVKSETSFDPTAKKVSSMGLKDDFSDLKKEDDESCEDETAEDILKKQEDTEETSLLGGTGSDCIVE